jgi:multimeric flavodoxin WrbA
LIYEFLEGIAEIRRKDGGRTMKVVAFNGSPRKDGNTAFLIRQSLKELEKEGIQTELIHLKGPIQGCIACYKCFESKDGQCALDKDMVNDCITKIAHSNGIILGSPTYFADLSLELKALIDRSGFVAKANGDMFRLKVVAAVVAARRAVAIHVLDSINHFFLISQIVIPGSSYWNLGMGLEKGDVEKDREGIKTMEVLGQNMAWLMKKING